MARVKSEQMDMKNGKEERSRRTPYREHRTPRKRKRIKEERTSQEKSMDRRKIQTGTQSQERAVRRRKAEVQEDRIVLGGKGSHPERRTPPKDHATFLEERGYTRIQDTDDDMGDTGSDKNPNFGDD
ncbi:hypothetical protein NDU88_006088 [Pleurodeles waltl]|uniref:Uncharacterized protein n=1 Tax=Pleurodeles waltl TaxID=8319 RepID=A0AAV7WX59_PLEWA|nr:hypothetical protein NDU88_006088 [Pleurodeles waltl]